MLLEDACFAKGATTPLSLSLSIIKSSYTALQLEEFDRGAAGILAFNHVRSRVRDGRATGAADENGLPILFVEGQVLTDGRSKGC